MSHAIAETYVRPASIGWRWRTVFQAVAPTASLRSLVDSIADSDQLREPLVIVSFESPVATRMLAFLQSAPVEVSSSVEGLLPISHQGRLKEAIVAAVLRAPATTSACDAAVNISSYVAKPYIRRSIQRLLAVDRVAHTFNEMLLHPPIHQILVQHQIFISGNTIDAQYTGPRIRCMTWPPEAQKSLVQQLESAGMPLGASVGDFTHLLCVVYIHDASTASISLQNLDDDFLLFGLLPIDHLPLGPSPDELLSNHLPSSKTSASDIVQQSEVQSACVAQSFCGSHCRAQYKLHEAIEALRDSTPIDFLSESGDSLGMLRAISHSCAHKKTDWHAIDVGAAPGGWTAFLAGPDVGCSKVMAVDAASLAPAVLAIPSVCHVRSCLQDALISGALNENAPYDLLVADLNADPRDCARWISPLFTLMKPGSALVLTMKLPHATVDSEMTHGQPIIQAAAELLSFGWTAFHCRWLMANTVKERTLFAFRRSTPVGSPPSQESGRPDVYNIRRSHQYRKARAIQRQAALQSKLSTHEVDTSS